MTSIYRPIIKNAWQILWRAKYLWFFGFFAALAATTRGEISLIIDNFYAVSEAGIFLEELRDLSAQGLLGGVGENLSTMFANFGWGGGLLILILLVVVAFLIWLIVVGQAGLIGGAYKEYRKQPSDFLLSFRTGRQNFWKVLWLNIVHKIIIYGSLLVVGITLALIYLNSGSEAVKIILIILSFLILIPLAVIISLVMRYAIMFVVLRKEATGQAIKSAWGVFTRNWLVSIEMVILLFLVLLGFLLAIIIASAVLIIPLSLIYYILFSLNVSGLLFGMVAFLILISFILLLWIFAAWSVFRNAAWVLLFEKLTESQVFSKIARWATMLAGRRKKSKLEMP